MIRCNWFTLYALYDFHILPAERAMFGCGRCSSSFWLRGMSVRALPALALRWRCAVSFFSLFIASLYTSLLSLTRGAARRREW